MLKLTRTYTDFDGNERTEDCYFNLTKSELLQMETMADGGLEKKIQKIINSKDQAQIMNIFKDILLKSFGIKSDDGKRFKKSDEIRAEFEESPLFDMIFMELATDAEAAEKFIKGIIPKDMNPDAPKAIPAPAGK